jgi:hypothetical protein
MSKWELKDLFISAALFDIFRNNYTLMKITYVNSCCVKIKISVINI